MSTSSSSQAAVKMCCWHIPIMRNYESYSEKNIFFPECCSGEKKQPQTEPFQIKYSFKEFTRKHILRSCNPDGLNSAKITM